MFSSPFCGKLALLAFLLFGNCGATPAQITPAGAVPAPAGFAMSNLRPALANVQTAIGNINVAHWKVAGATRTNVQQDVSSMQRDLNTTLPALMAQAEAQANGSAALSPSFAVFRNLDALYDVLLRVTETAALAGAVPDSINLEDARSGLEDGRAKLGAWLVQAIGAQDAQVAHGQTPESRPAAAPAVPSKIVVNDGPDNPKPRKKKPPVSQAPQ